MSLISISGRKGAGKDLVGTIIRCLLSDCDVPLMDCLYDPMFHDDPISYLDGYPKSYDWKVKKFADPIKAMVSMMLGCSLEDLEDRDFKEKELGEEWWLHDMGTMLMPYHPNQHERTLVKLTPRKIMQLLGTEGVRDTIHPNAWVNTLFAKYYPTSKWIITDTRFPNELRAVEVCQGLTINVVRRPEEGLVDLHPSETALDNEAFNYEITNNGTIQDLILAVRDIMVAENLTEL